MAFIYVSTPYRAYPGGLAAAFEAASKFSARLVDHGLEVYCPIAHHHPISQYTRGAQPNSNFWLERQKPFLHLARGLIIADMPGWLLSEGIKFERVWFEAAQKPEWLIPVDFETLPEDLR